MAKYKSGPTETVFDTEKGHWIPPTMSNKFWVEYQAWLADGNTPDPADPIPSPPDRTYRGNSLIQLVDKLKELGIID